MKTKSLILASLIAIAAVQKTDPYTDGQRTAPADKFTDGQ